MISSSLLDGLWLQKLKSLYKSSVAQAEQEEEVIRKALQKITEIRNIKNERRIQVSFNKKLRMLVCVI